ncbi:MAG: peptidylprolyl isomerase [Oscillospiraceae bacterium]|nr:peptidylprolyl isomerase [Oscillospiraceae bacterium]
MSEKENLGMTEQVSETKELSPAEKAKKKKRNYAIAKVVVAICVVLCIVLTVFEMGFTYRTLKAVDVDGTEYSVAEYNWLYTNSLYEVYNNLYQTYGELAAYFLNPQTPLDEQDYTDEQTWADYIEEYTQNSVIELTALYNAGKEAGFELEQEVIDGIDAEWEDMKAIAAGSGYSANDYAELNYGRGVNEKVFKDMYTRYLYAMSYAEYVVENEEVSSDDIETYYAEHADDFDSISYKSYFVSGTAEEGEDADAAMEAAKAEAEEVKEGSKEVTFTESNYVAKSRVPETYSEWLLDEARTAGDIEVFESETGYYVIEFVEENDIHYNTVDVRHILVTPTDETEDAKAAALVAAETYMQEWKDLGGTEEAFGEVAKEHSNDGSASVGGLYENVYKGQMVAEFEDWCFDSERKTGDCEIIETTYGYHVMYFVGEAEEYYDYAVDNVIRNVRYNDFMDSIVEGLEPAELMGYRFIAKHLN